VQAADSAESSGGRSGAPEPDQNEMPQGTALASLSRGRMIDTAFLTAPGQARWTAYETFPVASLVRSRRRGEPHGRLGIDWRRSVRLWSRMGRLTTAWAPRAAFYKPGRLLVLWDVSGSMTPYAGLYLPWLRRLVNQSADVSVFAFGTGFAEVTQWLAHDLPAARAELARLPDLWAGGTAIGAALRKMWARAGNRYRGGVTVLVISDGWDVGPPEEVSGALYDIRRADGRIVWVHPLAGTPGFEPRTRALLAARPHLERLVPGDSWRALWDLRI
jgi:uncharacterized protein with von Willebrand factor type A (vWA) domain